MTRAQLSRCFAASDCRRVFAHRCVCWQAGQVFKTAAALLPGVHSYRGSTFLVTPKFRLTRRV